MPPDLLPFAEMCNQSVGTSGCHGSLGTCQLTIKKSVELRNRVKSTRVIWVAPHQSLSRQPKPADNSVFFYGFKSVLGTAWAEAARGGKRRTNPPLIEPNGRHDGKPGSAHQSQFVPVTARPNISFPRAKSSSSVDRTRFLGSHPTSPLAKRRQPAVLTRSGVEPNTSRAILRTLLRVTAPPAVRPRATMSRPLFSGLGNRKSVREPRDTLIPDRRICALGEFSFLLKLRSDQTVRRWRPFARRLLITFWPSAVLMRFRNPWQVFRLLLFGWYVRFMVLAPCGLAKRAFYVSCDSLSST